MKQRRVTDTLRYKDRGTIQYTIMEGFDGQKDYLELKYNDSEKTYSWGYYWGDDGKTALEHIQDISYEDLKEGFVETLDKEGYLLHKGEYKLLKDSIVIFVSHKEYIYEICSKKGMC